MTWMFPPSPPSEPTLVVLYGPPRGRRQILLNHLRWLLGMEPVESPFAVGRPIGEVDLDRDVVRIVWNEQGVFEIVEELP